MLSFIISPGASAASPHFFMPAQMASGIRKKACPASPFRRALRKLICSALRNEIHILKPGYIVSKKVAQLPSYIQKL